MKFISKTPASQNFFKTKFLFLNSKNQKFILISKNLNSFFKLNKKDYIILDDV